MGDPCDPGKDHDVTTIDSRTSSPPAAARVMATLTATLALLVLAGCSSEDTTSPDGPATTSTDTTATGDDPSAVPEHDDGTGVPAGVGADDWQPAAEGFGRAFTDTSAGRDAWLAGLRPWVAPSLGDGYAQTDIDLVPTDTFEQVLDPQPQDGEIPTVVVHLKYAGGLLLEATVSQDPTTGRWVVTTVVPLDGPP